MEREYVALIECVNKEHVMKPTRKPHTSAYTQIPLISEPKKFNWIASTA